VTDVVVLLAGGWGSDGWGETAYGQDVTPDLAGALEADVGSVETSGDAVVGAVGLESSGAIGSVDATGISRVEVTGVEGDGQVNALRFDALVSFAGWGRGAWGAGAWSANETLPALSSQLGDVQIVTNVDVALTGLSTTASVGVVTVIEGTGVEVPLVGLEAEAALGDVSIIGDSTLSLTGMSTSADVGGVTQRTNQVISTSGLEAATGVGTVEVFGDANVFPVGLEAGAEINRVLVWGREIPVPNTAWTEIAA